MADSGVTLADKYKPRLWGKELRWNDLRRIGNSPIARASIAVPVLGYLILFNFKVIEFLKLHASACQDCAVPWRLHLFYFACCCFAFGSVVYAWRCPLVIKKYGVANDYFETEKNYFRGNLRYLFHQFEQEGLDPFDPTDLRSLALQRFNLHPDRTHELVGLMGQFYFVENRKEFASRMTVAIAYGLGFLFLAIPTAWTFGQVLYRFVALLGKTTA